MIKFAKEIAEEIEKDRKENPINLDNYVVGEKHKKFMRKTKSKTKIYCLTGDTYINNKYINTTVIACANDSKTLEDLVEEMAKQHNTKPFWTDDGLCYKYDDVRFICNIEDIDYFL